MKTKWKTDWTIVAFDHPKKRKSVLYRQNLDDDGLYEAIGIAIVKGANLMSIRGTAHHE